MRDLPPSSQRRPPTSSAISAAVYAGAHIGGAVVDRVDAVMLGAAEVDLAFNLNVTTRSDGLIVGGSCGHADMAAGAKLTVITTRLTAAGFPKIVPEVGTLTTPGDSVDVPSIEDLVANASTAARCTSPQHAQCRHVVAVSQYRNGSVMDVVREIGEN